MIDELKDNFLKQSEKMNFSDHMIQSNIKPHTAPVAHLNSCCSGVMTATYYFLSRYFDTIDDKSAEGMLSELSKLQETNDSNSLYGCMRWYREETIITDTNGAFFILRPIALTYLFCEKRLTKNEKKIIIDLLNKAGVWFESQCSKALYYSNKIMSDGAMLALISAITGNYVKECEKFWTRWNEYVDGRGFGWGENLSSVYSVIMVDALNIVILVSDNQKIKEIAIKKKKMLLDYITFHGNGEFIPSIRSYNFNGDVNYGGQIYKIFNSPEMVLDIAGMLSANGILTAILLYETKTVPPKFDEIFPDSIRRERIFDDSYAYTWNGENTKLGTISRFPVMPGCYQNEGWGLGWQSMPISFMIRDKCVAFLRYRTSVEEKEYSHPAVSKHEAYLYNHLFVDKNIPNFCIQAAQDHNVAIAVKTMSHIANRADYIYDELFVPDFDGIIYEFSIDLWKWYVLDFGNCSVAICPMPLSPEDEKVKVVTNKKDGGLVISSVLHSGLGEVVIKQYMISVWAIAVFDNNVNISECIKCLSVTNEVVYDKNIPRDKYTNKRKITCSDGIHKATLEIDPYLCR